MKKAAILIFQGFEEGATMAVVDVLRRGGVQCDLISAQGEQVASRNSVRVIADKLFDDSIKDYDMLVIPGVWPHVDVLTEIDETAEAIRYFNADPEKYLVGLCSATVALAKLGLVKGRKVTSYPSANYDKWFTESDYSTDMIVIDDKLITCRGPVTGFALGYTLLDLLGEDGDIWREKMLYKMLRASNF